MTEQRFLEHEARGEVKNWPWEPNAPFSFDKLNQCLAKHHKFGRCFYGRHEGDLHATGYRNGAMVEWKG